MIWRGLEAWLGQERENRGTASLALGFFHTRWAGECRRSGSLEFLQNRQPDLNHNEHELFSS